MSYWHKDRHTNQRESLNNAILSTDFGQEFRDHSAGKNSVSPYGAWTTGYPNTKEKHWVLTLHHVQKITKNGSKIFKKLNYELLRRKYKLEVSKGFLDMTVKSLTIKAR